jgi:NAD(P)-dependent dehydrogenase (short-subunit alcohol dehydrogenase family)
VALVTGATGGLGLAVCASLLASGATVYALGARTQGEAHERLRSLAGTADARLHFISADAQDEAKVSAAVATLTQQESRLDILINLIGGYAAGQPITEMEADTFTQMLELNLRPTFLLSKYAAREMARNQWGRIVNTASRAAYSGRRNAAAYAVAKAGVITFTEAQAEETRDQGITVNAIVPSIIDTPTNRTAMPGAAFDRWPRPEEIARVIAFLVSDDAALISGAHIPVYGRA